MSKPKLEAATQAFYDAIKAALIACAPLDYERWTVIMNRPERYALLDVRVSNGPADPGHNAVIRFDLDALGADPYQGGKG